MVCAAFELNERQIRPGKLVALWHRERREQLVWAGFARQESLAWWIRKGGELADIPAHRFAERSDLDGQLRWEDIPKNHVIRGVVVENLGKPLLKIVTRASTDSELAHFQHPRMPLVEAPVFSAEAFAVACEPNPQSELF